MNNFLDFYHKYRFIIAVISFLTGTSIILISTYIFKNDYYNTYWHWIVSIFTCYFMYFGYFGIKIVEENK
jgi:ABC-type transport system involved in cytochrome c biogenesis permease subunit